MYLWNFEILWLVYSIYTIYTFFFVTVLMRSSDENEINWIKKKEEVWIVEDRRGKIMIFTIFFNSKTPVSPVKGLLSLLLFVDGLLYGVIVLIPQAPLPGHLQIVGAVRRQMKWQITICIDRQTVELIWWPCLINGFIILIPQAPLTGHLHTELDS